MIKYWYTPKFVQQFIQFITPKSDTFTCVATKQECGDWTFNKWIIKDEPFTGNTDFAIDTIYSDITCKVPQPGTKVAITVTTYKPQSYDTVFSDPVPTTNGHMYTDQNTQVPCFVCDVAQVFFKGVPEKFYITVNPIAN
jgi:hypothetical protein